MKIIINEDQKKKLFVPRNIDSREKQYLIEIGMDPVIQFLKDKQKSIRFDISTTTDDSRWGVHDISDGSDAENTLWSFEEPIYKMLLQIAESIEGVYHIWGEISLTNENKLTVSFDYEYSLLGRGEKTYKL